MRAWVLLAVLAASACAKAPTEAQLRAEWQMCQTRTARFRIDACTQIIENDPNATHRAAALVERGKARFEMSQPTRAVSDFGRALREDGTFAQALVERGIVHEQRGAYENAIADFDAALKINPHLSQAASLRLDAMSGRSRSFAVQLDQVTRALARDPLNAGYFNERCWLRVTNNDELDLALADCNESLRLRPNDPNTLDSRGLVHYQRGEFADAEADYAAAVTLAPENGHYLYGRGLARVRLGQTAEGQADMQRAETLEHGVAAEYESYGVPPPI